ncbi:MAG TPA: hypothetical protein PKD72_12035, partial [Gemmatales bacterium]|nr:hypothetical protein [Gemmatales bacterium]
MLSDPVVVELSKEWTPWVCFEQFADLPYVFFLDSAQYHAELGRYSYLTAAPYEVIQATGRPDVLKALQDVQTVWQARMV